MKREVEALIRSAAAMDESVTPEMLELGLAAMRGERLVRAEEGVKDDAPIPPIVSIRDACRILSVTRVTVNNMLNRGILVRVYATCGDRAIGITRESVLDVMRGKVPRRKSGRKPKKVKIPAGCRR